MTLTDPTLTEPAGGPPFSWNAEEAGSTLTVRFHGMLDLAVLDECRAGLVEPLHGVARVIVFDLGGVTFADSSGLGVLIEAKRFAEGAGKRLYLTNVSPAILRLLELTGLMSWFDHLDDHGTPSHGRCPVCDGKTMASATRCHECGAAL